MWFTKKALKHSSRGDFEYKNRKPVKMLNGGHGQENIDYLDKNKIVHNTTSQYRNGVRLGNVSIHRRLVCREKSKQCWFPEFWTENDIKAAANYVLSLKKNQRVNSNTPKTGYFKGVKVGVYADRGKIKTVFPWYNQRR